MKDLLSRSWLILLRESLRPHLTSCELPRFCKNDTCWGKNGPLVTAIPKGWHFVFWPNQTYEKDLAYDGYDGRSGDVNLGNLKGLRRRWRRGELVFLKELEFERPGSIHINCKTSEGASGGFIERSVRLMSNTNQTAAEENASLVEHRELVYLPAITERVNSSIANDFDEKSPLSSKSIRKAMFETTLTPTRMLLFRFSALTFNGHRIHYDRDFAISEGLPDIIAQGSLATVLALSWVQFDPAIAAKSIQRFTYSCLRPIVADVPIRMCYNPPGTLWIEQQGNICYRGRISCE
ncbi:hypothetical protein V1511DRAFT_386869 [Dipodascopsis uninucleata]